MKVELVKPEEEVDQSKAGRVEKVGAQTDEVSAHSAAITFDCPYCGAHLAGIMYTDPQLFQCPDCGRWINVWV